MKVAGVVYIQSIIARPHEEQPRVCLGRIPGHVWHGGAIKVLCLRLPWWGTCSLNQEEGRESELRDHYWKDLLPPAQMIRLYNTPESALLLLRRVLDRPNANPMRLQKQLVENRATVAKTDAGKVLMSTTTLDAHILHHDTQEASSSNHPAAHGTHHHYNGPVTQYNVEHATNGLFGDNRGNLSQHAPGGKNETKAVDEAKALEVLIANMAPGAIHDSNERCDAPKCMEETRIAVQEDIMSWIGSGDQDTQSKKIMWVTGPAGTGKTAVLGTIADTCKEKGTLAASFFFSAFPGSVDRRRKRCFVPTLAFQLAEHGGAGRTREHVLSFVARDQGMIFTKNLKEQFGALVLNPLFSRAQEHDSGGTKAATRVVIIDGLDECDSAQNDPADSAHTSAHVPLRRKEDDQLEILSLLLLAASHPSFPFRILIASRPEVWIRNFFATDGKECTQELFLDKKYDPDADIALFYDVQLSIICRLFGLPNDWPGKAAKLALVRITSGQFVYAVAAMRYVKGPYFNHTGLRGSRTPHQRLDSILLGLAPTTHNSLNTLDALYRSLLGGCPEPELSMKWLRATQMRNAAGDKSPVWLLRLVLEASPGEENYALGSLASLLSEHSGESLGQPYLFYHKPFLDFIEDPARCGERFLTEEEVLTWVAQRFFQTLDRPVQAFTRNELHSYTDFVSGLSRLDKSSFETVLPYILSSDIQKWAAAWAGLRRTRNDLPVTFEPQVIVTTVLKMIHSVCSRYSCRSSCKLLTKTITDVLKAKGWRVSRAIQVLRRE
ncbi:hypothetical protein DFP72DRAFT_154851 [Ephemerocybe angulata]|uniref:Nephrocystin 3-like N-terminal domain-containing protein n=1 Tax=Ephemerocybe angulata TaxID=980116 RepID=A0A8H6LUQ6_9AGAR|nr:hypothetical protein DFP72DRAFT_154851 [Tulosesus angulatus]